MKHFLNIGLGLIIFLGFVSFASAAFLGPTQNPPGGNGLLIASSTRALGISTSTFYLDDSQTQWILRTGGVNKHINFFPTGNVGIGFTTPAEKLDVNGNVRALAFIGALSGSLSAANVTGPNAFGVGANPPSGYVYAFPQALAVGTTTVVGLPTNGLFVNGNIGVGTLAPVYPLDIASNNGLRIGTSGAIQPILQRNNISGGLFIDTAGAVGAANDLLVVRTNGGSALFTVRGNGNWSLAGGALTNLNMNGFNIVGANKIGVNTIDPLYQINGKKYATYVSSLVGGVKEEFVGRGSLVPVRGEKDSFEYIIDFSKIPEGSDLWVWRKAVDFSKENIEVLMTPYGIPASLYYLVRGEQLVFKGDKQAEFSYRLVGKRFDWRDWPTLAEDQAEEAGLVIE